MPAVPENVNQLPVQLAKYVNGGGGESPRTISSRYGEAWVRQWFPNELPTSNNNKQSNDDATKLVAVGRRPTISGLRTPPLNSSANGWQEQEQQQSSESWRGKSQLLLPPPPSSPSSIAQLKVINSLSFIIT